MTTVYKFGGSPELDKEEEEIINKMSNDFILRDGGNQFLSTLDMGINKISRVVDPIDSQDVATKKYVDDGIQFNYDLLLNIDTSLRNYINSFPKRYPLEYSFRKLSDGTIQDQNSSKITLSSGMYRVTMNCTLENVSDLALQDNVWICIYDKGKLTNQLKRKIFRVSAFDMGNEYNIFQTAIVRIPTIEDAVIRIFKDSALATELTTPQTCYFVLEKLYLQLN